MKVRIARKTVDRPPSKGAKATSSDKGQIGQSDFLSLLTPSQEKFFASKMGVFPHGDAGDSLNMRQPLPHQMEALAYSQDKNKIALFMEMRLGKSLVAVRWVKHKIMNSGYKPECVYGKTHRVLIMAPLTNLKDWESELIQEGIPQSEIHWLLGTSSKKLETSNPLMKDTGWFLVGYAGFRSCPELAKHSWFAVIADESTMIRSPKAQIANLCSNELSYVKYKAVLSGLPDPEDPMDFFMQFKFLFGGFMGHNNYWKFRANNFHQVNWDRWGWIPNRGFTEILKKELRRLSFIRTRKECNIGSKKIKERRFVQMSPEQKRMYKDIEKNFAYESQGQLVDTKWAPKKYIWLGQVAGGFSPEKTLVSTTKADELVTLLKGELSREKKVVVWFCFNHEIDYVRQVLDKAKISNRHIYGDVDAKVRYQYSDEFKTKEHPRVMLAQVKCAKFGLDWSVASTAIYFSNSYEMEDRAQSEDRIIHPKKTEPLLYIDLVTQGTVDEDVVDTLREKNVNAKVFLTKLFAHTQQRKKNE